MTQIINHKRNTDKLDYINIKNFYSTKDLLERVRRQATDWEKVLANHMPRDWYPIYKELLKFNSKNKRNTLNSMRKWAKVTERYFTSENTQMGIST